jgi:hypothetical protein
MHMNGAMMRAGSSLPDMILGARKAQRTAAAERAANGFEVVAGAERLKVELAVHNRELPVRDNSISVLMSWS